MTEPKRVCFLKIPGDRYDSLLCTAFMEGVERCGDTFRVGTPEPHHEIAVLGGLKLDPQYRETYQLCRPRIVCLDKGYTRQRNGKLYWKTAIGGLQPQEIIPHCCDRWEALRMPLAPMRLNPDGHVLFASSSETYCAFHGLGTPQEYFERVRAKLQRYTSREIVFRAKYAEPPLPEALKRAYLVVTHGSGAAVEALRLGVPVLVLGEGIARHLGRTRCQDVERPLLPAEHVRRAFFNDLAYCQWTLDEMKSGAAWAELRRLVQ